MKKLKSLLFWPIFTVVVILCLVYKDTVAWIIVGGIVVLTLVSAVLLPGIKARYR